MHSALQRHARERERLALRLFLQPCASPCAHALCVHCVRVHKGVLIAHSAPEGPRKMVLSIWA